MCLHCQDTKKSVDALLPILELFTKGRDKTTTNRPSEIQVVNEHSSDNGVMSMENRSWEHVRKNWNVATMVNYLSQKGFNKYSSIFLEQEVDGSLFCCVTKETLIEWGLSATHVSKFLQNRTIWQNHNQLD